MKITNKEKAIEILRKDGSKLNDVSEELRNDEEVVRAAVEWSGWVLKFASEDLKDNRELVLTAISDDPSAWEHASERLRDDDELVRYAATKTWYALEHASDRLKNDWETVHHAVTEMGSALKFASDRLKNDREIVKTAVENSRDGQAFEYASDQLKNDRELVHLAISFSGRLLAYASEHLRQDLEIVKLALSSCGDSLKYAAENFKADRELVMLAVKNVGYSLEYASKELKDDKEIVLEAVKNMGRSIKFASERLRDDKEIVMLTAQDAESYYIEFASERLRNDEDVIMTAFEANKTSLEFANERFRDDRYLALQAVEDWGGNLKCVSESLKDDEDIVRRAVRTRGEALEYASERLRNDPEIVAIAVNNAGYSLEYASEELKNDKGIVLAAVTSNGYALELASERLKNDLEIVQVALKEDFELIRFVNEEFKYHPEIILAAIRSDGEALKFYLDNDQQENTSEEEDSEFFEILEKVRRDIHELANLDEDLKFQKLIVVEAIRAGSEALPYYDADYDESEEEEDSSSSSDFEAQQAELAANALLKIFAGAMQGSQDSDDKKYGKIFFDPGDGEAIELSQEDADDENEVEQATEQSYAKTFSLLYLIAQGDTQALDEFLTLQEREIDLSFEELAKHSLVNQILDESRLPSELSKFFAEMKESEHTPLHFAIWLGDHRIVEILLEHDANPYLKTFVGNALEYVDGIGDRSEMIAPILLAMPKFIQLMAKDNENGDWESDRNKHFSELWSRAEQEQQIPDEGEILENSLTLFLHLVVLQRSTQWIGDYWTILDAACYEAQIEAQVQIQNFRDRADVQEILEYSSPFQAHFKWIQAWIQLEEPKQVQKAYRRLVEDFKVGLGVNLGETIKEFRWIIKNLKENEMDKLANHGIETLFVLLAREAAKGESNLPLRIGIIEQLIDQGSANYVTRACKGMLESVEKSLSGAQANTLGDLQNLAVRLREEEMYESSHLCYQTLIQEWEKEAEDEELKNYRLGSAWFSWGRLNKEQSDWSSVSDCCEKSWGYRKSLEDIDDQRKTLQLWLEAMEQLQNSNKAAEIEHLLSGI